MATPPVAGPVGAVIGGGLAIVATAGSSSGRRPQRLELTISSISMSRDDTCVFCWVGGFHVRIQVVGVRFFYWSCFCGWVNVSLRIEVGGVVCCFFSDYFEDQSRWAQLPKGKV